MKCPSLGTALPCLLPQPRGLRPTAANREPVLLPTPMGQALQSANQGLMFALERGLEAFWLQKCHDHVCGPAAALSIPLMRELVCAPCTGEQSVGGSLQQAQGYRGLKQTPGPSPGCVWVTHRVAVWLLLCAERGSAPTVERGRLVLLPVSTVVSYLQQGLFSKSSLKWLCLSSLLLYELKKTKNKTTKQEKPNPNNYKYKDSHTPDTCSLRDSSITASIFC